VFVRELCLQAPSGLAGLARARPRLPSAAIRALAGVGVGLGILLGAGPAAADSGGPAEPETTGVQGDAQSEVGGEAESEIQAEVGDELPTGEARADLRDEAQPEAPDPNGPVFRIGKFDVRYAEPHPDQPPLWSLLPVRVTLEKLETGLAAPTGGGPTVTREIGADAEPALFHASAIGEISSRIAAKLAQAGLLGVYVAPDDRDLDLDTERDLREAGNTTLRLVIKTARIRSVRTIATGNRIRNEWRIDNAVHRRIRELSPLQPTGALRGGQTDLVREQVLDDYLFRLNRHPGRRVDAALAPAGDGAGIDVDFLVSESKPWFVYGETSNTGTDATEKWQQRFGYVNNQMTDRDDTLSLEWTNAGTASNGVNFSYEAPWFSSQRPWWWRSPEDGPSWLSFLDRSKLPWFGSDRVRWRVFGSYVSYAASQIQGVADVEGQQWNLGGRLIVNVFQHHRLFVDLFGGGEMRGVKVKNKGALQKANQFFFLPQAGLRAERVDEVSNFFANLTFEGNFKSIDQTNTSQDGVSDDISGGIEALGRSNPDDKWMALNVDASLSQFLEPLFDPSGWKDPSTANSSTLAHELFLAVRGQYAFNYRLIPQAEQVLGGLYSVRGYTQSAAVGDNIAAGTIEYRFHLPHSFAVRREPINVPILGRFRVAPQQVYGNPDWDLILRVFGDAGVTHRNKRPKLGTCGGVNEPGCPIRRLERGDVLVGAGAGLELRVRSNFRARIDWARALKSTNGVDDHVKAGDDEIYLFFSLLY